MQNYPNKKTFGLDKHFLTPGTADNTLQVIKIWAFLKRQQNSPTRST